MILGQVTESWVGLGVLAAILLVLGGCIVLRKPRWPAVWLVLLTPLPWIALTVWAGWHWREAGPQTGFQAETWGLLMLGLTLALGVCAVMRASRVRWPVAALCLVNFGFTLIAALFAVMMTTGGWL